MKTQRHNWILPFIFLTAGALPLSTFSTVMASPQSYVQSIAPTGQVAPRLQHLGSHTFPVTTKSQHAQLFINQGVMLAYGFNHAEAARSFREAARLDADCAMA